MLKKIALAIVVILLLIMAIAATRPDSFTVERSISIKAPPEKIMSLIADFHNWKSWSPWEHLDPDMKRTFSGAPSGKGAIYEWTGNSDVGRGRMEVTEHVPPSKAVIALQFMEPIASTNMTTFALTPEGDTTKVTWTMNGPMPFMTKVVSVFASMDTLVGKDFDKGLARMKTVAEK